jgi:hypothetical protein
MQSQSARAAFGGGASFADLYTANEEVLPRAYPADANGSDTFNRSTADAGLAQHLAFWTGRHASRMARLMWRSSLVRPKWEERDDYLARTIANACRLSRDVLQDKEVEAPDEAARRRQQLEEAMAIGDGLDDVPPADVIDLESALTRFVYLTDGKRVADLDNPRHACTEDEFHAQYAASVRPAPIETAAEAALRRAEGRPKPRAVAYSKLWMRDPRRKTAQGVTFNAGAPVFCKDPDGRHCINTWRAPRRPALPVRADYQALFGEHVAYLFGDHAALFLDWLAHVEQRPGELPHTGFVHVSDRTGTGRNWMSAVLCRVWPGLVAAGYNLTETLDSGFNGRLAGKILAVDDEIRVGGGGFRHATQQRLKSIVTESDRLINPKYGRQHVERNACRWLLFSNHPDALAIDDADRRFNVIRCSLPVKPPDYYRRLYGALADPAFAVSVAAMLAARDLRGFNPGAHSLRTEARAAMIAASRPELVGRLMDFAEDWPADVVLAGDLRRAVGAEGAGAAWRHAVADAGFVRGEKVTTAAGLRDRCFVIRNHALWQDAPAQALAAEAARGRGDSLPRCPAAPSI